MKRIPIYIILSILAILTLIPFTYMAMTSLKDADGNSAGLFLPWLDDRKLPFTAADVNLDEDTIKTKEKLWPADVVIYHAYAPPPAKPAATGPATNIEAAATPQPVISPIGGLTDGQTYYAIPITSSKIKLALTPDAAQHEFDSYQAAIKDLINKQSKDDKDQALIDQAGKNIKGIDLTSAGTLTDQQLFSPSHILWGSFTFQNFKDLFNDNPAIKYQIANSFFFASVTSLLATLCCAMGGYALAMFHFKGRAALTTIVLAALIIPGTMLAAPNYQLIFHMKLLDTFGGLILPAIGPAFLVFLFRQAMLSGMPPELLEAGRIDGCGEIRMFFQIALPLVRPMVSASLLITFIACWNNFISPQVILQSPRNFTLSVAVAQLQDAYSFKYGTLMAGTVISVLPVMILFLLLQKEFIAGLTAGAVKG
ncbi:MAG TPA: carbohydrate ABC transporter permease [Phycisphaerae bacterium]|jgi:ABC-type glycerol-3-phosphate transport system permease component